MRIACLALLVAGCAAKPQPSNIIVEPDPLTGAATAYTTVFLAADNTRLVLSAPTAKTAPVAVTLWLPADAVSGSCDTPTITVDGHAVTAESVDARVLETPSGADQTVAFALPPAVLRAMAEKPAVVSACGSEWAFDDQDRHVVREFSNAVGRHD